MLFSEHKVKALEHQKTKRNLLLPRILWGLHHSSDQTTVALVMISLGGVHRLVREPVNMTTQPQVTVLCVFSRAPALCTLRQSLWSWVFLLFACVFSVYVSMWLSPLFLLLSSSTEHIFSLRSIPSLLSYVTALSQVTILQQWCKGLQDNCTSCLALLWQRALLKVVVDFSTHFVWVFFFLEWISCLHESSLCNYFM